MPSLFPEQFAPDPSMFALNWYLIFEILFLVIILAFMVERVLALVFESDGFLAIHIRRKSKGKGSFKPLIAFLLAFAICWQWHVDLLAVVLVQAHSSLLGEALTAALVAGGSKASIKLFRDLFGVYSTAYKDYQASKKENKTPPAGNEDGGE